MQKSYECEVATHIEPESCGAAREGGVEALTGERAGRVAPPKSVQQELPHFTVAQMAAVVNTGQSQLYRLAHSG
jgi:hypothetical protein